MDEQLAHLLSLIHPPTPPNMSLPLALPPSTSSQQPLNEEEKLERQKQKKLLRRQLFFRQKPPTYLTSLFSDPYNYVRFYMPSLFSSLVSPTKRPSQFLYLDCDTVCFSLHLSLSFSLSSLLPCKLILPLPACFERSKGVAVCCWKTYGKSKES